MVNGTGHVEKLGFVLEQWKLTEKRNKTYRDQNFKLTVHGSMENELRRSKTGDEKYAQQSIVVIQTRDDKDLNFDS